MQLLYNVYCQPSTLLYSLKETWGSMSAFPSELFYLTLECFYEAAVACHDAEV